MNIRNLDISVNAIDISQFNFIDKKNKQTNKQGMSTDHIWK